MRIVVRGATLSLQIFMLLLMAPTLARAQTRLTLQDAVNAALAAL